MEIYTNIDHIDTVDDYHFSIKINSKEVLGIVLMLETPNSREERKYFNYVLEYMISLHGDKINLSELVYIIPELSVVLYEYLLYSDNVNLAEIICTSI